MFKGFTPETLAFFAAIQFNNNRGFFEENRKLYEAEVQKPLIELAEALLPSLLKIDPDIDPRPNRLVSRIYRDLRFRKDKTPYRDYMWIGFRRLGESREETCGFYFDLSASAVNWGCGYYHMQPETMANFRKKLMDEPKRIQKILKKPEFASRFEVMGECYKKKYMPPEDMPAELAALFPKKSIYAEHHQQDMDVIFSPDLVCVMEKDFEALTPFYSLMRECMVKRIEGVDA